MKKLKANKLRLKTYDLPLSALTKFSMSSGKLLDTKTVHFNEIIGNGKIYRVPAFQRDYSWEQDNWEDLWNDIEALKSDEAHYLGTIVLQSTDKKEFAIIDGQQRLTTLSLLALAIIKEIKNLAADGQDPDNNAERVELLIRQYIGQKDPSSLTYSSKLFLNENNDGFYQQRLLQFKDPLDARRLSDSDLLLWKSFCYFQEKIRKHFPNPTGGTLADFLSRVVGEGMLFIQIVVEDELNAYTVFETLNSRGMELSSTDLLKNFLFSKVAASRSDLANVKTQWKKIIDLVGLKGFPVFLRYFLMATRKLVSKEYLFREIRQFVRTDEEVFALLDQLELFAMHYMAFDNPEDDYWKHDKELVSLIRSLQAFRVTQWKPLGMVASTKWDSADFKRLLKAITALSFRYNVIARKQTNDMEKVYSKAAVQLFHGEWKSVQDVISALREIYIPDEDFRKYFEVKSFNTRNTQERKLARYTLYHLEAQQEGGSQFHFELDEGTIEHILPESYPDAWKEYFSEEEYERNVFLLGNLTLLEPSKNRKADVESMEEKSEIYQSSKFALTRKINSQTWNPAKVKDRQEQLAKLATAVWRISFS